MRVGPRKTRLAQAALAVLAAGGVAGCVASCWQVAVGCLCALVLATGALAVELIGRTDGRLRRVQRIAGRSSRRVDALDGKLEAKLRELREEAEERTLQTATILARVTDQQIWIVETMHAVKRLEAGADVSSALGNEP